MAFFDVVTREIFVLALSNILSRNSEGGGLEFI